jgi:hypothetical protein
MITTIVSFPIPQDMDPDEFWEHLSDIAPHFQQAPGLYSKSFLLAEDGSRGGGVYLWRSRADAVVFDSIIRFMIVERVGVEAEITYFDTPIVVDNRTHEITYT